MVFYLIKITKPCITRGEHYTEMQYFWRLKFVRLGDFYKQIFAELEISRHLKIYKWADPLENLPFPWTKLLGIHQMDYQNLLVKKPWLFGTETRLKLIFLCPSTTWQKVRNHLRFEFQLPHSKLSTTLANDQNWKDSADFWLETTN